ncbi:10398_t:CDS:2 [Ambispora gerdemannii]|uniref:10398_t:CDS:1 n=1 Tax=Ambispora gerdemannii TaxID=144530 RepID=A0A9N8V9K7_9GLOM|nr:10398_t:CDS:2 [Ambispora gerdemannii]
MSEIINKKLMIEKNRCAYNVFLGKKQPTEYEKNQQRLLTTKDSVRKKVKSKKRPRTNDDSVNDQMGRTLTLPSSSIPANINENNHTLAAATYSDQ